MTKYSDLNEIFMAISQDFKPQIPFFVYFMGKVFQPRKQKKYNNNNNNNNSIVIIIIVINFSILKTKDCKMGIKTNLLQNNIMNLTCTAMYKPGILNDSNIISENK